VEEVSLEICQPYDRDLPGKAREDDSSGGHDNEDDPKQLVSIRGRWSRSAVTDNSVTGHPVSTVTQVGEHSCWLVLIVTRCHEHCSASRQLIRDVPKGPVTSFCYSGRDGITLGRTATESGAIRTKAAVAKGSTGSRIMVAVKCCG
jgi:hypothetical protein